MAGITPAWSLIVSQKENKFADFTNKIKNKYINIGLLVIMKTSTLLQWANS